MLLIAFLLHHLYVGVTRPSRIFVEGLRVPDYANSTCWEAMVLGGNSNSVGRQWCWEAIVLGGKSAGSILYYGHNIMATVLELLFSK